jgi:hypothetical protein
MSEIFGAAGQIASAAISAGAIKDATQMQIDALNRQRDFVFSQLNPDVIQGAATSADITRAQQKLALQAQIDPALLGTRYAAQGNILSGVQGLNGGPDQAVANVAAQEGVAGVPGMQDAKKKLVDAALHELSLGATLPPDIQNELVQTGLEKTGMVTGSASAKGFGGHLLRQILGTAGEQLQAQRQQRASALTQTAQGLEQSRQQILGTLFPNLASVQLGKLTGAENALQLSNNLMPAAGLGGTDIANLWLARVGATNSLAQSAADAAARGGMGQAQAWQQGISGAIPYGASLLPTTKSAWGSMFGSGGGGAADAQALAI